MKCLLSSYFLSSAEVIGPSLEADNYQVRSCKFLHILICTFKSWEIDICFFNFAITATQLADIQNCSNQSWKQAMLQITPWAAVILVWYLLCRHM